MKKLLYSLVFVIFSMVCAAETRAQTKIVFAKGASEKTVTVTIPAGGAKIFSVAVRAGQVINAGVSGDVNVSKKTEFPVISLNLTNANESLDRTQDGEAYLSILAGRNAAYVISVANSDRKRARTFALKIAVSNNREDFLGGEEVEQ